MKSIFRNLAVYSGMIGFLDPASEETYKWADELLEITKAKHRDKSKAAGWFGKKTFYEMER